MGNNMMRGPQNNMGGPLIHPHHTTHTKIKPHELCQVADPIRNPASQNLQDYVSRAYNAGLLRRLNLGVCCVMWVDDYDKSLGLFAARCDYLKPGWFDIRHRVIDVGFLGSWWISSKKML